MISNKNVMRNTLPEPGMEVDNVLKKYGLTRDTAQKYIDAITQMNQTQAAEETDVSGDTISRYKRAFQKMTSVERLLLISSLAQDKLLEETTKER